MMNIDNYIKAFQSLHTATIKEVKAPHKAVLLLAMIDAYALGILQGPKVKLTEEFIYVFKSIWRKYLGTSAIFTPDITKPFFHMQHESFWRLISFDNPEDKDTKDLPKGRYSVKAMREAFQYAEIDEDLFNLLKNADTRAMLRVILISTYLTNQPTKSFPNLNKVIAALPLLLFVA